MMIHKLLSLILLVPFFVLLFSLLHAAPSAEDNVGTSLTPVLGPDEQDAALLLTSDVENGARVYRICTPCHDHHGWGSEDGLYPELAGQHRQTIIKQLADIRALNRDVPDMYPFALASQLGGIQAIADVAAYIEKLPPPPSVGVGQGDDLDHGKTLYTALCASCHGGRGEGNQKTFSPRLQGQHYAYMMRQLEWMLNGRRRNADPQMTIQIQNLSLQDRKAVLDYASRLPPAPGRP